MATGHPGFGDGNTVEGERYTNHVSGRASGNTDATNEPGQYPVGGWGDSIFGGPLPDGTGAPGTQGASYSADTDPTNEPGQTEDGLTGITEAEITQTGAPGTQGAAYGGNGGGGEQITFTKVGSFLSDTNAEDTVNATVDGPTDWTQANDSGYATGGPQLPGIRGNEPQAGKGRFQPGAGRVMRGGRAINP